MTKVDTQIIQTWRIHNRTFLFMIENIPNDGFSATLSTRGGRDVSRQLAHMHMLRVKRLGSFAKKTGLKIIHFDNYEHPGRKDILQAFEQSGIAMEKYMTYCIEQEGAVPNFKRGLVPMLGYYISHEAHHRGHLILTMKQCGIRIPDALRCGIWEWNKI